MKLLIIEDEQELAKSMGEYLQEMGYRCEYAASLVEANNKIQSYAYDCILLDIMLPDGDGFRVLEELKAVNKQDAVIIISAKHAVEDKIKGLHIGADDYITKPFHLSELTARIYAIIRRKQFNNVNVVRQQELCIDLQAKTVSIHEELVALTKKEFDLLLFFIGNKNRVISKSTLAEHLSGDFADMLENHDFVYAHIKNLKRKLHDAGCGNYLKTVYGTGYKWESHG